MFGASIVHRRRGVDIFVRTIPFRLFGGFPSLSVHFFGELSVFQERPFVFVPNVVNVRKVGRCRDKVAFVDLRGEGYLFVVQSVDVLFRVTSFVRVLLIVQVRRVCPIVVGDHLRLQGYVLGSFGCQ